MDRLQLSQSDVVTFHDYSGPEAFERRVRQLLPCGRPIAKRYNIGMIKWVLVDGKTQTRLP